MTYCLGIKVASGLVAIADTRLTSGTEVSTNKKVSVYQSSKHSIFVMTSGLRSVRDKAITYFKEVLEERDSSFNKLYKAVNALASRSGESRMRTDLHFMRPVYLSIFSRLSAVSLKMTPSTSSFSSIPRAIGWKLGTVLLLLSSEIRAMESRCYIVA